MIEKVKEQVYELLNTDDSGHGMDHINRVLELSLKFAEKERADKDIVSLIALLHDVDDYKLFGTENSESLSNAKLFMKNAGVDSEVQKCVIEAISSIGYSRLLNGFRPQTIEGKVVSDADMCDAVGVNGIMRTFTYSSKNGKPFFDKNIFPIENMDASKYTRKCADSSVCHIFEKVLKLKKLMLTESGKQEIEKRHQITVEILYQLFDEENAPEWREYLDSFLNVYYG